MTKQKEEWQDPDSGYLAGAVSRGARLERLKARQWNIKELK